MQANKKYIYDSEKAPIYVLSHSKAPKCSELSSWHRTDVNLSFRNNFTKVPSKKFPFL